MSAATFDGVARIEDYAIIGNGRSVALVSREGSIDWLCWPQFDSPPLFAQLLDSRAGSWRIAPIDTATSERAYVDGTNVLETRFTTASGTFVITDVMPVASEEDKRELLMPEHEVLRLVSCERGVVDVESVVDVRPDFGRKPARVEDHRALGIHWQLGRALLALRGEHPHTLADGRATARFTLRAGESACFSLTYDREAPAVLPLLGAPARAAIERSIAWWRDWSSRARYDGPARDRVVRSALALRLMLYAPSGAIIAAPTTSLPEREGSYHNWDYRFCWLRDASFTARVLLDLGYLDEATAFSSWLLHATRLTLPEVRVTYDVYGNEPLYEEELPELEGYRGSRPVRVGNVTFYQLQLDTYGEVIDAVGQIVKAIGSCDRETQKLLRVLGDFVCANWRLPDAGIWEPRGELRHRTHSRLCCWLALDRLLELHRLGLVKRIDVQKYEEHRAAIRLDIETYAWDARLGCYTSELGPSELDVSVLLMTWYAFHEGRSARMRSTYARLCERLGAGPGLLYRYEHSLRIGEGAFWICSFWAVEHLVRGGGSIDDARRLFELACMYENDLGLMAEELDPFTAHHLGNFPQAYTHVGLISAALSIEEYARDERERAPSFAVQAPL